MARWPPRSVSGCACGLPVLSCGWRVTLQPCGPRSAIPPLSTWYAAICATRSTWPSEGGAMMNLAEYRRRSSCLADFLPWAALVETGIVLNKDGSLQRTARFRGPDLDSATQAELV